MFSRFRIAFSSALLLAVALILPAFAGGWAVITLDKLPTGVVAGEPFTIGFTVMQHGKTPMKDLDPTITATLSDSESFVVHATPEGKTGHYVATLTFPKEGNWSWSIQAFTMDQAMPELSVAAPVVAGSQPVAKVQPISLLLTVRYVALAIGLMGLLIAFRRKSRLAVALTVISLLVIGNVRYDKIKARLFELLDLFYFFSILFTFYKLVPKCIFSRIVLNDIIMAIASNNHVHFCNFICFRKLNSKKSIVF